MHVYKYMCICVCTLFRSQLKKFLGSTVRKTVGKAKMIAHEVSHVRQKEEMIDIPDELTGGEQHVKVSHSIDILNKILIYSLI